ncbi:hypothetical protein MLD38_004963 [Melastoma candidum]|uniref:Uncharacterized protein n=1 Tax=Melastoma candidum TaxID=119954 RepID=A0ACB9S6V7_9MYRT|nr:hypothetical protein MLD38_004963 [Melastoma candidum]
MSKLVRGVKRWWCIVNFILGTGLILTIPVTKAAEAYRAMNGSVFPSANIKGAAPRHLLPSRYSARGELQRAICIGFDLLQPRREEDKVCRWVSFTWPSSSLRSLSRQLAGFHDGRGCLIHGIARPPRHTVDGICKPDEGAMKSSEYEYSEEEEQPKLEEAEHHQEHLGHDKGEEHVDGDIDTLPG